jgi:UDP-N-acetylglucosamine diphosphorylase / glucose-1-phosphate thymidylyltransferase / UDP-N-acetylgalactosamine diphosphorylase / glucosamine-1-phosphate N-acetyltransferase / galactosamine-1-phosphate N-acetyltransferase
MKLILFHDDLALRWTPFVETRPLGELLYGVQTLRERAARALGAEAIGYVGAPHLAGFDERGAPPVLSAPPSGGDRLLLCTRAVLEPSAAAALERVRGGGPTTLSVAGRTAGWLVPPGTGLPGDAALRGLHADPGMPSVDLDGELLERPWHLMAGNAARIAADAAAAGRPHAPPPGAHVLGSHPVLLEEGAEIEPGVTIDVRGGPVWLGRKARVEGPARLTGPLFVGAGSTVLGGPVGLSSIGPVCKVRGEVTDSVINGYCNKAHDGHLGHAVLGCWVNLGAGTINSDLKNTYSSVRVRLPEGDLDTGLLKVGCFMGDHVKTGIGTVLNTGTVVGTASNLFGGRMPPVYVPPFSWGSGDELVEYELERGLETVAASMRRRQVELTPGMRQVLGQAAERGRSERASKARSS